MGLVLRRALLVQTPIQANSGKEGIDPKGSSRGSLISGWTETKDEKGVRGASTLCCFESLPLHVVFFLCLSRWLLFIYCWPCWVFFVVHELSLVAVSKGYSAAVCGLLTAVASLIAEHGLLGLGASDCCGFSYCRAWALGHGGFCSCSIWAQ